MRNIKDEDKFNDPFESAEVCAFLFEAKFCSISQFKSHFNFTNSRVDYYLKTLKFKVNDNPPFKI